MPQVRAVGRLAERGQHHPDTTSDLLVLEARAPAQLADEVVQLDLDDPVSQDRLADAMQRVAKL